MKQQIIEKATEDFLQYGFKSFTMDDLAQKMGMSKKTLYEYYASKNDLVEACVEYVLVDFEQKCYLKGKGNVIENLFEMQKNFIEAYKITSNRPLWELKKYYPKLYEKVENRFRVIDDKHIEELVSKGLEEKLFRENIDLKFVKHFFHAMMKMKEDPKFYPETEFSFWQVVEKQAEYLIRILANENGIKQLETILSKKTNNK
ncbi:TetR/AcrR family transcriptional regulator [Capnocytophaga sp.]|uniref:TetR/AcrR family transcriptional regulator n=1 Tax=Capnocytophaga sp. TaxID=44737 RepID=UPI0026DC464A|nr:TetR/AcrR family transcriptional regulator [Capnocytophaga sp.]MDO5105371.1 TetR/AcrR family transcriptional regulator [Capnocytophaga sp.]